MGVYSARTADEDEPLRIHVKPLAGKMGKQIALKDSQGKLTRLPAAGVETRSPVRISLMPELLLRDLTAQDDANLLEYLSSLK